MLTKNWYEYFKAHFGGGKIPDTIVRDVQGNTYAPSNGTGDTYPTNEFLNLRTSYTGAGMICGDGAVAPSIDDYKLSGNVISTIERVTYSRNIEVIDSETVESVATFVLKNIGDTPVTITEVGWQDQQSTTGSTKPYFLFDRTLLDTPVVINPGEQGAVVYRLRVAISYDNM